MSYQVFISYRRDGGEMLAMHLAHRLREKGLKVFFDMETMRSGKFNEQIFSVIDGCSDFLLILTEGSLDRCDSPSDWVRLEIEHALKANKNIIPVLGRNFEFPEILPESIDEIRYCHGLHANTEFFDAVIEKLISLLKIETAPKQTTDEYRKEFLSIIDTDYKCLVKFSATTKSGNSDRFDFASKALYSAMEKTYEYYETNRISFPKESRSAVKIVNLFNDFADLYQRFYTYPTEYRDSEEAENCFNQATDKFGTLIDLASGLLPVSEEEFHSLITTDYRCLIDFKRAIDSNDHNEYNTAIRALKSAMQDTYWYYEKAKSAFPEKSETSKMIVNMFNQFTALYN